MKKTLLLWLFLSSFLVNAQNATFYSSKSPFKIGEELTNEPTSDFIEGDNIYALVVIDQELPCSCEEVKSCEEAFSSSFMYFPKGDYKSARSTWNHVESSNGKTYVFLDIYPNPEFATGRDATDYSDALTRLTVGSKGKITFTNLEGDGCYGNIKVKLKKATITLTRDGSLPNETIHQNNRAAKDVINKKYDAQSDIDQAKREEAMHEENKLAGKLPEVFYSIKEASASRSFTADQVTKLIIETKDVLPEGSTYLSHRTKETKTKYHNGSGLVDYYTQEIYVSFKDSEGNCKYRLVYLYEHVENGSIISQSISTISSVKAAGGYYYTTSTYFNCANLNK